MIGFMSVSEMVSEIKSNIHKIPQGIDVVVGIPRSGMIPAYLIGLHRNVAVIDLPSFLTGKVPEHGQTRAAHYGTPDLGTAQSILLVDDSVCSGASIGIAMKRICEAGFKGKITSCVVVVEPSHTDGIDVFFRKMPVPRVFEWNAFHHPCVLNNACMDIDGVLCPDPNPKQNDDGPRYTDFIRNAPVKFRPTYKVGRLVSARLQKYRGITETWLERSGIQYGDLHLLDLASAAERRRKGAHASFKAQVYAQVESPIFYESDSGQAAAIARLTGKPVLCTDTMKMHYPALHAWPARDIVEWKLPSPIGYIRQLLRSHA